ncbi:hypothetical protein BDN67DRAFT_80304 [Paxillus ammoniavirescens]|nr:hypothetical protein BDN67DRAFT_80304 [Paxillus ammoniavirescens]
MAFQVTSECSGDYLLGARVVITALPMVYVLVALHLQVADLSFNHWPERVFFNDLSSAHQTHTYNNFEVIQYVSIVHR